MSNAATPIMTADADAVARTVVERLQRVCTSRDVATVEQSATTAYLSPGRAGERITAQAIGNTVVGRSESYQVVISGEGGRVIATFHGVWRATGGTVLIPN
ncbi:hypothetical protein [Sphingomonas sp. PP-CC-3G-468]|uniref:hypothetical protein n=1 Tax=Sphingomonas sp. PP-CC-3G-468 TaxID=2135656 RepID=UPI00104B76C0|nr:hypothetical protein [Sphingomonas sp. PP-CC-3G-468]TCM02918.1 hypothetical protein C8J41_11221 [Sphingomonas sp. PP-CC-3G-468]